MAKLTMEQLKVKMERWAREMPGTLRAVLSKAGKIVVGDIQSNYLTGQALNVVTGTLRRSMSSQAEVSPRMVSLKVGTNVWYGRIHELELGRSKGHVFIRPSIQAQKPRVMEMILDGMMKAYKRG